MLNGIGNFLCKPDLLDRAVIFNIPPLKETRPEEEFAVEWNKALPGILGGFFTAISKAMTLVDSVKGHEKFRMSDFARWGAALAESLGYSQEEFFFRYRESVENKWQDSAEVNPIIQKLTGLVESKGGEWIGSATMLLQYIKSELKTEHAEYIPRSAKAFGAELMRIAPVMRAIGIDILRCDRREPGTGRKLFVLRKNAK